MAGKIYKMTFELYDGTKQSVVFEVPNGEPGKSAYEYAKEGGYTGTEEDFAKKMAQEIGSYTETDPTVPEWAKNATKPTYTKDDVGLGNVDNVRQYSESNQPPYPVTSVNGKTGAVSLSAADVGARPSGWMPTAEDVGALPATYTPPNQTAEQVGADSKGTAAAAVAGHNTSTESHGDLRQELKAISTRLNSFLDVDDQTMDELSEVLAIISSNKSLIDAITTSKVSVSDIVNNLITNVGNRPLSAAQGVALKGLIDALSRSLSNYALKSAIPTKVSQLQNDSKYLTQHQDISHLLPRTELPTAIDTALAQAKASGEFDGYTPQIGVDYWTAADQEAIVQQVITEIGAETIPDYVVTEAMSVLDRVVSAQGSRTFVLGAITDMHYGSSDYIDGVIHACQGMHHIAKRIKLDALGVLGDYTDEWQMDNDAAVTDNEEMNALLDRFNDTVNLRVKGNHDHRPGADAQTYRYIMAYSDDVVWGSRLGGYFYRDFPAYKLRIICLNTTEVSRDNVAVSDEQYNFFVNALDMSANEDASEWGILILSHHPLDWEVTSGVYRFGHILNAYQNGDSWTDGTISCDYAEKNSATIVGNIHGHIHNLLTDKIYVGEPGNSEQTSVWRMAVPASRVDYPNHYGGIWAEKTTYSKTPNSAKDTAFNIICIDLDSHTIKAFCYGAGYDRTLMYQEEPEVPEGITNLIDTIGYTNDKRYSTSSHVEKDAPGYVLTGSFTLNRGDVLRTDGVNFDAAEYVSCSIVVSSNDNNTEWGIVPKSTEVDTSSGGYVAWTLDEAKNLTLTAGESAKYVTFRLCGYGAGENLIVTVNQPIRTPSYTNQLNNAINSDGTPYRGTNGEIGYKVGYRIKSDGSEVANADYCVTGFMPIKAWDYVYLKNMNLILGDLTAQPNTRVAIYDSSFKTFRITAMDAILSESYSKLFSNLLDEDGGEVTTGDAIGRLRYCDIDGDYYIRFSTKKIDNTSIVTINEPIV